MKNLFLALSFLLVTACVSKTTYLSMVVPDGANINVQSLNRATVKREVTASDSKGILLFFPLGFPKFEEAVRTALRQGGGNILTDITVVDEFQWYILFGYNKVTITANVVNVGR